MKRTSKGIEDIKDKDMEIIGKEREDYFLDDQVFLKTRIRDNFRQFFPVDEDTEKSFINSTFFEFCDGAGWIV